MPRPLADLQRSEPDTSDLGRDLGVTRKTGRSFATAVAVLLLAALVVNRSTTALVGAAASANSMVSAGTIELSDDDGGSSLFRLTDLTPTRPAVRCIELSYTGTMLPVSLEVRAKANGELREHLDIAIDQGTGGSFDGCDGFEAGAVVFDGPLVDLLEAEWIVVDEIVNEPDIRSFRIEVTLRDDQEALGTFTTFELDWEVAPS